MDRIHWPPIFQWTLLSSFSYGYFLSRSRHQDLPQTGLRQHARAFIPRTAHCPAATVLGLTPSLIALDPTTNWAVSPGVVGTFVLLGLVLLTAAPIIGARVDRLIRALRSRVRNRVPWLGWMIAVL